MSKSKLCTLLFTTHQVFIGAASTIEFTPILFNFGVRRIISWTLLWAFWSSKVLFDEFRLSLLSLIFCTDNILKEKIVPLTSTHPSLKHVIYSQVLLLFSPKNPSLQHQFFCSSQILKFRTSLSHVFQHQKNPKVWKSRIFGKLTNICGGFWDLKGMALVKKWHFKVMKWRVWKWGVPEKKW